MFSNPTLLLIHGAGGTLMNWPPQLRRLEGVTVYAVDLPGHGDSAGNGSQSIAAYRERVLAFADALATGFNLFSGAWVSSPGAAELELLIRRAPSQWHMFQPNWPSDPGYDSTGGGDVPTHP